MVILRTNEEIESILQEPLGIEFDERFVEGQLPFYRIGVRNAGAIQLFYCIENIHKSLVIRKLNEIGN